MSPSTLNILGGIIMVLTMVPFAVALLAVFGAPLVALAVGIVRLGTACEGANSNGDADRPVTTT